MKTYPPLILGMCVGIFAVVEFFVPAHGVSGAMTRLLAWGQVLAAMAYVLGGINVLQVNWPKIRRRERDWGYKVLLLVSAAVMFVIGLKWHELGTPPVNGQMAAIAPQGSEGAPAIRFEATREDALVKVGARAPQSAWDRGQPRTIPIPADTPVKVKVFAEVAGIGTYEQTVRLKPGERAVVRTNLATYWGPEGRWYVWFYDHVFDPCNSTMFALLAFFIASAAFRAFRARNFEAGLLLGSAIIVMLGRVPIGRSIGWMADWFVAVPNNAGRRAIMMGAALGAIVTGLRVILGIERSHLGQEK